MEYNNRIVEILDKEEELFNIVYYIEEKIFDNDIDKISFLYKILGDIINLKADISFLKNFISYSLSKVKVEYQTSVGFSVYSIDDAVHSIETLYWYELIIKNKINELEKKGISYEPVKVNELKQKGKAGRKPAPISEVATLTHKQAIYLYSQLMIQGAFPLKVSTQLAKDFSTIVGFSVDNSENYFNNNSLLKTEEKQEIIRILERTLKKIMAN